jgi:hypothetical protein
MGITLNNAQETSRSKITCFNLLLSNPKDLIFVRLHIVGGSSSIKLSATFTSQIIINATEKNGSPARNNEHKRKMHTYNAKRKVTQIHQLSPSTVLIMYL